MKKNRKKLAAWVLSLGLVLSMAACGDAAEDDEPTGGNVPKNESSTPAPEAGNDGTQGSEAGDNTGDNVEISKEIENFLAGYTLVKPDGDLTEFDWEFKRLPNTGWNFAGGILDGVEMGEADIRASLELWGGRLCIIFEDNGETVDMLQGGGMVTGSVSLAEDGYLMNLVFQSEESQLSYIGALAVVENVPVLLLFSDTSAQNVLFFTHISEK